MTKIILTTLSLLYIFTTSFSQDTLYTKKDTMFVSVQKVTKREVYFKYENDPKGPDYLIKRRKIEKLSYLNGIEQTTERKQNRGVKNTESVWSENMAGMRIFDAGYGITYEHFLKNKPISWQVNVGTSLFTQLYSYAYMDRDVRLVNQEFNSYFMVGSSDHRLLETQYTKRNHDLKSNGMTLSGNLNMYLGKDFRKFRPVLSVGVGIIGKKYNQTHANATLDGTYEQYDNHNNETYTIYYYQSSYEVKPRTTTAARISIGTGFIWRVLPKVALKMELRFEQQVYAVYSNSITITDKSQKTTTSGGAREMAYYYSLYAPISLVWLF
jgi:hypothetical protein